MYSRSVNSWVRRLIAAICFVSILMLAGCGDPPSESMAEAMDDNPMEHAMKHMDPNYVCPMHPQIISDEPGNCPICGMDLVQRERTHADEAQPVVELSGAVMQNMGVRTARAGRGDMWKYIRTVGRVEYDETRIAHIHPRADGWIEGLTLRAEGESVNKDQLLAQLYSPDILSAQVEFLVAVDKKHGGGEKRKLKARNMLRLLDVPNWVISEIERSGETRNTVPVLSPINGVVTRMMAREGMYVTKSSEMFTIADLSRVWLMVDVYEHQIGWIKPGLEAEISVPAHPGKVWEGKVDYLYPDLDAKTRTLRVRLVFSNPDLALKPNMFADVVIYGGPKRDVLRIPAEALIRTGERTSVVKVVGEGRFQPVDVVTGMQRGDRVEIIHGLDEGDEIVVSGQFLIDSEANLQASYQRMSAESNAGGLPAIKSE